LWSGVAGRIRKIPERGECGQRSAASILITLLMRDSFSTGRNCANPAPPVCSASANSVSPGRVYTRAKGPRNRRLCVVTHSDDEGKSPNLAWYRHHFQIDKGLTFQHRSKMHPTDRRLFGIVESAVNPLGPLASCRQMIGVGGSALAKPQCVQCRTAEKQRVIIWGATACGCGSWSAPVPAHAPPSRPMRLCSKIPTEFGTKVALSMV